MSGKHNRFKIVTNCFGDTPVPQKRVESKYFILLRFGCQTGAQVPVSLGRGNVNAGCQQETRPGRQIGQWEQLASTPDGSRSTPQKEKWHVTAEFQSSANQVRERHYPTGQH